MELPQIEGYRVLEKLAEGGVGVVYLAERTGDRALVALKVLKPGTEVEEKQIRRFLREASVGRQLTHPHILPVRELLEWRGEQVLALDYVRGASLRDWSRGVPREDESALTRKLVILSRVADALDYAHREGVIHRDVKPTNILVREDGHPFLIDFGLARRVKIDSTITSTDKVVGSPPYMSPEQIRGQSGRVDHRTDIYSLGATAFEVLTGRFPFLAETQDEMLLQVLYEEPPRLSEFLPSAPPGLEGVVLRALEKDPRHRYPSAAHMRDDLERVAQGLRPKSSGAPVLVRRKMRALRRHRLRIALGAASGVAILALAIAVPLKAAWSRAEYSRFLLEGDREFAKGRPERALGAYRAAAEVVPEGPEPHLRQASVLADYYLYAQASRCLAEAERLGHSPNEKGPAQDAYQLGLAHLLGERYAEAADAFGAALGRDPELFEAHLLRFRALDRLRKQAEARDALERFRESRNELDPLHSLARALLAILDGDANGAVKVLEELRRRTPPPDHPIWLELHLAMWYERAGDPLGALDNYARALERTKPEPVLHALACSRLGYLHARARRFDLAREWARRALARDAEFGYAHRLLAVVAAEMGDLEEARSCLERARRRDPDDPALKRFHSEVVFLATNQVLQDDRATPQEKERAYSGIEACLELQPEHLGGLLRRAMRLWTSGHNEEAVPVFQNARDLIASWSEPADSPLEPWERYFRDSDVRFNVQVGLFGTSCQVGREDLAGTARAWLRDEYERNPDRQAASILNLAEALAECPVEALRDCSWARRLVADHRLGFAYADRPDARAILQKIASLCP